jgi:AsmA protein
MPLDFLVINFKKHLEKLEKRDNPLQVTQLRFWFRVVVRVLVLGAALWAIVFSLFWLRVQEANLAQQWTKALSVQGFVLRMDEGVSAQAWPVFGLKVGRMVLTDPQGKTVLTAERSAADLYFWPLLWGEPVVSGLTLTGVHVDLNETQPNVWPLALWWQSVQTQSNAMKLNLDQVEVQDLALTLNAYLNQSTKQLWSVQNGQLSLSDMLATPSATFSGMVYAETLSAKVELTAPYLQQSRAWSSPEFSLTATGQSANWGAFSANLTGLAEYEETAYALTLNDVALTLTESWGQSRHQLQIKQALLSPHRLEMPALQWVSDRPKKEGDASWLPSQLSGEVQQAFIDETGVAMQKISLNAAQNMGQKRLTLQGSAQLWMPHDQTLQLQNVTLNGTLSSLVAGESALTLQLLGLASFDVRTKQLQSQLQGTLDDHPLAVTFVGQGWPQLAATNPSSPKATASGDSPTLAPWQASVHFERLNLNRYWPMTVNQDAANLAEAASGAALETATENADWRLDALADWQGLTGQVLVDIDSLKWGTLDFEAVHGRLEMAKNALHFKNVSLTAYAGTLQGEASIYYKPTQSVLSFRSQLNHVQMQPLLIGLFDYSGLTGTGSGNVTFQAEGNTESAWRKSLKGNANLSITAGSLSKLDLNAILNTLPQKIEPRTLAYATPFSQMTTQLTVDGLSLKPNFALESPLLTLTGQGKMDLDKQIMDIRAVALVSPKGLTTIEKTKVPLRITGPLTAPLYALDFSQLLESPLTSDGVSAPSAPAKGTWLDDLNTLLKQETATTPAQNP